MSLADFLFLAIQDYRTTKDWALGAVCCCRSASFLAPLVGCALAHGNLIEGASLRFHPHMRVAREHGARDVAGDAHDHLVPAPELLNTAKPTATTPQARRRRHLAPSYHLAAPSRRWRPRTRANSSVPKVVGFSSTVGIPGWSETLLLNGAPAPTHVDH